MDFKIKFKRLCGEGAFNNPLKLLHAIEDVWNFTYGSIKVTGKEVVKIEIHTGGWSDNEYIINCIHGTMFWILYWQKSVRGGHYYFTIRIPKKGKKI